MCVYDEVKYVYDDVTYVYDDVTNVSQHVIDTRLPPTCLTLSCCRFRKCVVSVLPEPYA